jgi:3-deoxy-7-phosphoheptulonate synthase
VDREQQETRKLLKLERKRTAGRARTVQVAGLRIGAGSPTIIAGPCSVEPGYVQQAVDLAETGIDALRAGVYKPRTHPDSFQGMGADALPLLVEARRQTGLPLISEVLCAEDAEALGDLVDGYQVGARNMHNYRLLEALGEIGRPVILKRGLSATIDEWISASEYIRRRGNDDVVLCERGIRTFETRTRNTLDISAVIVAHELTDLPVIVDPSHAAGRREWVSALARAALAAGADGLLVEAHPSPAQAWSDAAQTIDLEALADLVGAAAQGRPTGSP